MRYLVYRPREAVNIGTPERPVYAVREGPLRVLPYRKSTLALALEESWGQVELEEDEMEEEPEMDSRD